ERAGIDVGGAGGAVRLGRAGRGAAGAGRAVVDAVVAILGAAITIRHTISTLGGVERDVHVRAIDLGAARAWPVRRRGPKERARRRPGAARAGAGFNQHVDGHAY